MRISPPLSGLLSEVVYKEEEVFMSDEEASLLQEELNQTSEQIESDSNDLNIVTKSLSRTFEIVNDMQTAIDTDTTDKHTASLLLSEFASIYKDTLGQSYTYSKNLSDNPHEVKSVLTAGLQASTSFIDTLKTLIKKIWESIKAAAKWFWSKVKQFINWIFGSRKKAVDSEMENSIASDIVNAATETKEEFKSDLDGFEGKTQEQKNEISERMSKEFNRKREQFVKKGSEKFGSNYKSKADKIFDNLNNIIDSALSDLKNTKDSIDRTLVNFKIIESSNEVSKKIAIRYLDKLNSDKSLLKSMEMIMSIAGMSSAFFPHDNKFHLHDSKFTLDSFKGHDGSKFSLLYSRSDELVKSISRKIEETSALEMKNKKSLFAMSEVYNALYTPADYDYFVGLKGYGNNPGYISIASRYLDRVYKIHNHTFEMVVNRLKKIDKSDRDIDKKLESVDNIGLSNAYLDFEISNAAAMTMSFKTDNKKLICEWSNRIVSGQAEIEYLNIESLKKEAEEDMDMLMSYVLRIKSAINVAKEDEDRFGKTGSEGSEDKVLGEIKEIEKTYEKLMDITSEYIQWFSDADIGMLNHNRELFNSLFRLVQHLDFLHPQKPFLMLANNQKVLNTILESFNFREELITVYKEVLQNK